MNTIVYRRLLFARRSLNCLPLRKCSSNLEMDTTSILVAFTTDVVPDNLNNNPAMAVPTDINQNMVDFENLTQENLFRGLLKNSIMFNASMSELNSDEYLEKTKLQDVLQKLCQSSTNLSFSSTLLDLCYYFEPRSYENDAINGVQRNLKVLWSKRFSPQLYKFIEQSRNREDLTNDEKLLLRYYSQQCEAYGCHLKGQNDAQLISEYLSIIRENENTFMSNISKMPRDHWVKVNDPEVVKSLPDFVAKRGLKLGSVTLPAVLPIYNFFLTSCPNRSLRYQMWYAYNNRAAYSSKDFNSIPLDELREKRKFLAKICGHKNYAEMSTGEKMAGNVDAAKNMIDTIHKAIKPRFCQDLELLNKLHREVQPTTKEDLQVWDIPYLENVYRKKHSKNIEISRYLSYDKILLGLCEWFNKLFNITIEEVPCKNKPRESTSYFRIIDHDLQDEVLGHFYMDLYSSKDVYNGLPQVIELVSRCKLSSTTPLVYFLVNKRPPVIEGGEVLLTFKDFAEIVYGVARVLTTICNRRNYSEISRVYSMPRDQSNWFSNFVSMYLLSDYSLIQLCTMDRLKKTPLSRDRFELLRQQTIAFRSTSLTEQLFLSALDLALHVNDEYWKDVMEVVWKKYMDPLSLPRAYNYPMSLVDLASKDTAAGIFTNIWSQMIAADCFMKFKEAEEEGIDLKNVGKEFKMKILYPNGPTKGAELFRDFRGRDPSVDPLLELYNLSNESQSVTQEAKQSSV